MVWSGVLKGWEKTAEEWGRGTPGRGEERHENSRSQITDYQGKARPAKTQKATGKKVGSQK